MYPCGGTRPARCGGAMALSAFSCDARALRLLLLVPLRLAVAMSVLASVVSDGSPGSRLPMGAEAEAE